MYINSILYPVKCECGKYTKFISTTKGFRKFCSVKCASNSDEVRNKTRDTNLSKWGVDSVLKNEIIRQKSKQSLIIKWGVDNISKNLDIKKKKEETMIINYGVRFNSQRDTVKKSISDKITLYNKKNNINRHLLHWERKLKSCGLEFVSKEFGSIIEIRCPNLAHNFKIHKTTLNDRLYNLTPICTICNPVNDLTSFKERELFEFIVSITNYAVYKSYRNVLEIDVYIPELKLGFEFNGLYWHSDKYKDRNYHIDKTNHFKNLGIRIIHIWEDDWKYRKDIIKSQIGSFLNNSTRLWGRKCKVAIINDVSIAREFLDNNHIQGSVSSVLKIGLYLNNSLVSIMTFDHFEGRKRMLNDGWNINRFCNLRGTSVVGGFSKMLKFFISNYKFDRIITYADVSWSIGDVYVKCGFNKISESSPDYKYIMKGVRVNKSRMRSSKEISEKSLKYLKIWDCGKIKYEFK